MRNLLLVLVLANILYFLWGTFVDETSEPGVAIVNETDLGPPLQISDVLNVEAATSVGAVLGSGKPSDLAAVVGRSWGTIGPRKARADPGTPPRCRE